MIKKLERITSKLRLRINMISDQKFKPINELSSLEIAFVQGAKWAFYCESGFTMFQVEVRKVEDEARKRKKNKTLGKLSI